MEVSCGVIVTDGRHLLAVKPWGRRNSLDIPKGKAEVGETEVEAAARELKEETGLIVRPKQLIALGRFKYIPQKDLSLFLLKVQRLPPVTALRCTSTFVNQYGVQVPEVVGFDIVEFTDPRFFMKLQPILSLIQKRL